MAEEIYYEICLEMTPDGLAPIHAHCANWIFKQVIRTVSDITIALNFCLEKNDEFTMACLGYCRTYVRMVVKTRVT